MEDCTQFLDEQQRVDEIINQSNGSLSRLVNDTNGDGIWDTTYVMIGMISENQINQTGKWENYKEFFSHVNDIIAEENRPQEYRVTQMTQTGLSKILEDVSDAIYLDLLNMMHIISIDCDCCHFVTPL